MYLSIKRFLLVCLLYSPMLLAEQNADPQQVVQKTTDQVLAIIKDAKIHSTVDSQKFTLEVTSVIDSVVDFDSFARSVMGTYASEQRYKALTSETEKLAFREQIKQFKSIFKQRLVNTYVTSLLDFNGEKIDTAPLQKGIDLNSGSASIIQVIHTSSGKSYTVQYSMHKNKDGEWKLKNLIIEGVNLGLTYRNQFAESASKYKGDIDKVIANWNVESAIANTSSERDSKPGESDNKSGERDNKGNK